MILENNTNIEKTLISIMNNIPAAYCLLIIVDTKLYVLRDRYGIRPLSLGYKDNNIFISSETKALENCTKIREIKSGEILRIDENGVQTIYNHPKSVNGLCAFELIYFMNPKSYYNGMSVRSIRKILGETLAKKEKFKNIVNI